MKPTTVSKLNSLTPEEKKDLLPLVNELLASKKRGVPGFFYEVYKESVECVY